MVVKASQCILIHTHPWNAKNLVNTLYWVLTLSSALSSGLEAANSKSCLDFGTHMISISRLNLGKISNIPWYNASSYDWVQIVTQKKLFFDRNHNMTYREKHFKCLAKVDSYGIIKIRSRSCLLPLRCVFVGLQAEPYTTSWVQRITVREISTIAITNIEFLPAISWIY